MLHARRGAQAHSPDARADEYVRDDDDRQSGNGRFQRDLVEFPLGRGGRSQWLVELHVFSSNLCQLLPAFDAVVPGPTALGQSALLSSDDVLVKDEPSLSLLYPKELNKHVSRVTRFV